MAAGVMQEAIDKEIWEAQDKGLKIRKKPAPKIPEPKVPIIKDQLKLGDVPLEEVTGITANLRQRENDEGFRFIGMDVVLSLKGKQPKKGWMTEGDFYALRREVAGRVDTSALEF